MNMDHKIEQKAFAIIEMGGKQYRVFDNDIICVEKTGKNLGETIKPRILAICDEVTQNFKFSTEENPITSEITLEVVEHDRNDKVLIFKRKRRKNHQRLNGHKQHIDWVKIKFSA